MRLYRNVFVAVVFVLAGCGGPVVPDPGSSASEQIGLLGVVGPSGWENISETEDFGLAETLTSVPVKWYAKGNSNVAFTEGAGDEFARTWWVRDTKLKDLETICKEIYVWGAGLPGEWSSLLNEKKFMLNCNNVKTDDPMVAYKYTQFPSNVLMLECSPDVVSSTRYCFKMSFQKTEDVKVPRLVVELSVESSRGRAGLPTG